jgi:hypothetical protein
VSHFLTIPFYLYAKLSAREQLGHLGIHSRTNHRAPRGRRWRSVARSVRPIQGFGRPSPATSRALLSPSDSHVVPYDGSRCMGQLEAVCLGCGPLNPCAEHVALSDSSGGASLGLMRCHGHMASCMPTRHHVAWCGSHWAQQCDLILCISLSSEL